MLQSILTGRTVYDVPDKVLSSLEKLQGQGDELETDLLVILSSLGSLVPE